VAPDQGAAPAVAAVPRAATPAAISIEPATRVEVDPPSEDDHSFLTHVTFSPDGRTLVIGTASGLVALLDAQTGREQRRLAGLPGFVTSLELSADGAQLLTVSRGEARLWELSSGRETWRHEVNILSALHFVPDGRSFAECDPSRVVTFLDRKTGAETKRFGRAEPHDEHRQNLLAPTSIAFSPDGKRMAAARWDQRVILWDLRSGEEITRLPGRLTVQWSSDGRLIATATGTISKRHDRTSLRTRLFDGQSWKELRTFDEHDPGSARFSPDSRWLAAVGDGEVRVWDPATGKIAGRARHAEHVPISLAFARGGRRLATGGRDGDVVLWRLQPRQLPD
jgi:WD40 repeat protein